MSLIETPNSRRCRWRQRHDLEEPIRTDCLGRPPYSLADPRRRVVPDTREVPVSQITAEDPLEPGPSSSA